MKAGFRTKVFIGSFAAAALSLLALAGLMPGRSASAQRAAIERRLTDEAYLIADLLSQGHDARRNDASTTKPIDSAS